MSSQEKKNLQRQARKAIRGIAKPSIGLSLIIAVSAFAQSNNLELTVITSSPGSLNTNFSLISGVNNAVLVDVPFLRSDAYRLVADILDSGKHLETIVVTHAHPAHYFSVDVFKDAFPNVEVIASPRVVEEIWSGFPNRLGFWGPQIGGNAPRYPYIPTAFEATAFDLEGHTIEILGPMQGDADTSTAIYIPDLNALIAGDIVFNQVHVYAGNKQQRAAWIEALESLSGLQPDIVVAGHTKQNMPNTLAALEYTRTYLLRFERAIDEANTAEELMAIMRREYPDALDFQGDFILTSSSTAAMQEKLGQ